jgi:hypothetical protein
MKRRINQLISMVIVVFVGLVLLLQPGVLASDDRETMRDQHSGAPSGPAQPPGADYLSIPGASFVPACTCDHLADAEGGVAITGGSSCTIMVAPVLLPDGALIYGMDLHYYDNVASERLEAMLWRQNPHTYSGSGFGVDSPWPAVGYDTTGHHSSASRLSVNNSRYNYQVEVRWSSASANLWLMGVTIVYTHP